MKILIITTLALLISLTGVMAMAIYCGDSNCDRYSETYDESNPLLPSYCPLDCGSRINDTWCEDTYDLRSGDCPACGSCSDCTTSRISTTDLNNWCSDNGFSNSGNGGSGGFGNEENSNKYSWLIFLIIGIITGYYYKKKYG